MPEIDLVLLLGDLRLQELQTFTDVGGQVQFLFLYGQLTGFDPDELFGRTREWQARIGATRN